MAAVRLLRVFVVVLVVALLVWFHDFKSPPTREDACSPYVTSQTEKLAHGATRVGDILHQMKDDATAWTETQIDEAVKGAGLVVGIVWRAFKLASKVGKVRADQAVTGMVPTPISCAPCPADSSSNGGDSGRDEDTWDPKDAALSQPLAQVGASWRFSPGQIGIARAAIGEARKRNMPERAMVVILAAGFQESGVRNLDYGDRDSIGWLQQRNHYGTRVQRLNPAWAAGQFFDRLKRVGGWQQMTITRAAWSVQISAHPDGAAQFEDDARALLRAAGGFPDALQAETPDRADCTVPAAPNTSDPKTPAGWDRLNGRTVDQAVAWLEAMDRNDTPIRPSMCLHYMGRAYGYNGTGISSAYNAWQAIPASLRHEKDRAPPKGGLMFWGPTPANRYGHVAISLGGGRAASTDWPVKGSIGTGSVPALIGWPRGEYLGWTSPYFPGRSKMPVDSLRKGAA